jgi:predicted nucleic acid-binding protein
MSGTDKTNIYYWDACAYLAWIKNEEEAFGKDAIDALAAIVKDHFDRKVAIVTSTITLIEVLSSSLSEEEEKRFRLSFKPGDHLLYEVDPPIAFKARDFRERLLKNQDGKTLPTPDAIHLATAVICKADAFITFDEGKKNKRYFGLLELNKDPRVDGLEICRPEFRKPPEPQRELFGAKQPDLPTLE